MNGVLYTALLRKVSKPFKIKAGQGQCTVLHENDSVKYHREYLDNDCPDGCGVQGISDSRRNAIKFSKWMEDP